MRSSTRRNRSSSASNSESSGSAAETMDRETKTYTDYHVKKRKLRSQVDGVGDHQQSQSGRGGGASGGNANGGGTGWGGRSVDAVRAQYAEGVSLRQWVTEDDLAETVAFLVSPAAGKISGQIIAIDGNTERMV